MAVSPVTECQNRPHPIVWRHHGEGPVMNIGFRHFL